MRPYPSPHPTHQQSLAISDQNITLIPGSSFPPLCAIPCPRYRPPPTPWTTRTASKLLSLSCTAPSHHTLSPESSQRGQRTSKSGHSPVYTPWLLLLELRIKGFLCCAGHLLFVLQITLHPRPPVWCPRGRPEGLHPLCPLASGALLLIR